MPHEESMSHGEGNAPAALKAMTGEAPDFKNLNVEASKKWDTDGNANEALLAMGAGPAEYGASSSIIEEGPAKMPTSRETQPPYDLDKASA